MIFIFLIFQIPPAETHNGPLRGFKIAYRLSGVAASSFIIRKIANSAATQGNIDGLVQWTMYEIKVLAYNDAGDGKYSNPITVTTAEGSECFYYFFLSSNNQIEQGRMSCRFNVLELQLGGGRNLIYFLFFYSRKPYLFFF